MACGEAEIAAVLQGGQSFVAILAGLLEGIKTRRKALRAVEPQLGLEGGDGIAEANLLAAALGPFVEQKQRQRELISGIAQRGRSWAGDPAQTEPFRLGPLWWTFQGDVSAVTKPVDVEGARHLMMCAIPAWVVPILGGWAVIAPGGGDLNGGAPLNDQAEAGGGGKPGALAGGISRAVVGVILVFSPFLADGGVVAGFFPRQIRRAGQTVFSRAAGLLLKGIGHQKVRSVPNRGRLG
jgi:hypothetical protein